MFADGDAARPETARALTPIAGTRGRVAHAPSHGKPAKAVLDSSKPARLSEGRSGTPWDILRIEALGNRYARRRDGRKKETLQ